VGQGSSLKKPWDSAGMERKEYLKTLTSDLLHFGAVFRGEVAADRDLLPVACEGLKLLGWLVREKHTQEIKTVITQGKLLIDQARNQ
jgi:hypothetical protein